MDILKTIEITHLKWVNCIVCELDLRKAVYQQKKDGGDLR